LGGENSGWKNPAERRTLSEKPRKCEKKAGGGVQIRESLMFSGIFYAFTEKLMKLGLWWKSSGAAGAVWIENPAGCCSSTGTGTNCVPGSLLLD
jgi:hypothetical protein